MNKELLCKDCIHSFVPWKDMPNYLIHNSPFWVKCRKTEKVVVEDFNPVMGGKLSKPDYKDCMQERRDKHGICGPEAKQWSPKHKKDLFKLLMR